eukprot:SAG31_NODE_10663_length_1112_cov_2.853899_1_plen_80_part_10
MEALCNGFIVDDAFRNKLPTNADNALAFIAARLVHILMVPLEPRPQGRVVEPRPRVVGRPRRFAWYYHRPTSSPTSAKEA